jgi:hypothetical protein
LKEMEKNEEENEEEGMEYMLLTFCWPRLITACPGQDLDSHHHLIREVVAANNLATTASATSATLAGVAPPSPRPWPPVPSPPLPLPQPRPPLP